MHSSFTIPANRRKVAFGLLGGALLLTVLNLSLWLTTAQPAQAQTAGTTGTTINVFCLDYGKTFPEGQTIQAKGLALDKVRGGLAYALSKGYIQSQPYQVQLAMWNLQDGKPFHDYKSQGTTIAQEITNNAGTVPSGDASAVANLTFTNIHEAAPQSAYGTATIQGNASTNGLPVGFLLPASDSSFQNLVAVLATAPAAATTVAPTTTVAATTTTVAPTTTVAATTTTVAPTTTVAATTTMVAPNTTVAPTATPAPAATATANPTAAPNVPATGLGGGATTAEQPNNLTLFVVLFVLAALLGGIGLALLPRKR